MFDFAETRQVCEEYEFRTDISDNETRKKDDGRVLKPNSRNGRHLIGYNVVNIQTSAPNIYDMKNIWLIYLTVCDNMLF